ncbi:hypothetical protein ACQ4PT_008117 [Festuca glaucescens]
MMTPQRLTPSGGIALQTTASRSLVFFAVKVSGRDDMKPAQLLLALLAVWAVVVLMVAPAGAQAATCNAMQLTPCAGAIVGNAAPSAACCSRLKAQQPCMCQYARDPNLKQYVDSANGKKVMAACKVPIPSC